MILDYFGYGCQLSSCIFSVEKEKKNYINWQINQFLISVRVLKYNVFGEFSQNNKSEIQNKKKMWN